MKTPTLFLATPTIDGTVTVAYHRSVMRLVMTQTPFNVMVGAANYDTDIVRTRSWLAADFLESDATHLLFVDADIDFTPELVAGLVAAEKDYVCAPYRKKREEVDYPGVFLSDKPRVDHVKSCVEVAGFGLGMTLLSREMLSSMSDCYSIKRVKDRRKLTASSSSVALFDLIQEGDMLHSEDFSFGYRWREMGGSIWLYLGTEVCGHIGQHRFAGAVSDFKHIDAEALRKDA